MFDRSRTRFHGKKAAQHFHCAVSKVFDRVKSVALWSANIRKLAKVLLLGYFMCCMHKNIIWVTF